MNTKIKLRAWDGQRMIYESRLKEYDHYHLLDLNGDLYPHLRASDEYFEYDADPMNKIEHIIMFSTNNHDKKQTEIFQSDFVKDSEETYLVCFGEWEYDTYSFIGWYLKGKSGSFGISSKDCEQLEVIGNLYENGNLLNF